MYTSKYSDWSPSQDDIDDEGLADVFYTNERKELIHVRLNRIGITLQKGSNSKEKLIKIDDIIGGRCVINKSRSFTSKCGCSSLTACSANYGSRTPSARPRERDVCAYFHVYAYVLRANIRNVMRRERTVLVLRFCSFDTFEENMQEAERWSRKLNNFKHEPFVLANETQLKPTTGFARRILMFLNPKSGSGKARRLFQLYAAPVLSEADLPYDLHITKHINYAKEFVRLRDLSAWSNIIAIGGDGLFFEILNGLLKRKDWQQTVQRVPLGIVPCGSGNGLAKSISHIFKEPYEPRPILSAALTIVRGHTSKMDVVRLELKNQILYSFLSVGWGFISDIDIESERLRSLGYQRFTIWSLHRLISLRTYRGRVSYLLKTSFSAIADDSKSSTTTKNSIENLAQISFHHNQQQLQQHGAHCPYRSVRHELCKSADCVHGEVGVKPPDNASLTRSFRSGLESFCSADSCESIYYSIAESVYRSVPSEQEPLSMDGISLMSDGVGVETISSSGPNALELTLKDPLPENWIVEEGEFVMVQATYQTHLSTDCHFSPASKLNDGTIYLTIIQGGIGRSQLLQFLINMSSGTHIPLKQDAYVKVVAVSAFRIEPEERQGILTVDGERVELGPIQGAVLPEMVQMIVPN